MIQEVQSLDLPELAPYRTLRRPHDHIAERIAVAEGEKVVRRLLESSWEVLSLLMTPEAFGRIFGGMQPACPAFVASRELLSEIVGIRYHQGALAIARVPEEPALAQVLAAEGPEAQGDGAGHRTRGAPLLVALDGLAHAENVGVIVRSAAAFGASALLVGPGTSSPYLRRAVRNSMGAVFTLPVLHCASLVETLQAARAEHGVRLISTGPRTGHRIDETSLRGPVCLVIGNEESGVSAEISALCDERLEIPMRNGIDSLNAASACAVFFYEAARQRAGPYSILHRDGAGPFT